MKWAGSAEDRAFTGIDLTVLAPYPQFVRRVSDCDAERAMLMGGACIKTYGWSPKKR
jgi:hypothetical protein